MRLYLSTLLFADLSLNKFAVILLVVDVVGIVDVPVVVEYMKRKR